MIFQRLSFRIGAPIVLLVLFATAAMVGLMAWQIAVEDELRFEEAARRNASFFELTNTAPTENARRELSRLLACEVWFRTKDGRIGDEPSESPTPELRQLLLSIPADQRLHRIGDFDHVAVPIHANRDGLVLVLRREHHSHWLDPRIGQVLLAFWLLAFFTAWIVSRRLSQPLRELAAELPRIEQEDAVRLSAAERTDEIGDLARAFVRTREALQQEKATRQRMEKLAVLGRMTAALAHEVQNPVAAIRLHAQLLRGTEQDAVAATVDEEAARIEGLLNQWMFLTRPEPPALRELDLVASLRTVVGSQRARAEHAAVTIELEAPDSLLLHADGKRLQHVFRNLVDNAIQAMPTGGRLWIRVRRDGDRALVTFADEGRGFSNEALRRYAEFFYSEKEGGMGIGLSVAHEIAKAHGGSLHVENRSTGGAQVTVELPTVPSIPGSTSS